MKHCKKIFSTALNVFHYFFLCEMNAVGLSFILENKMNALRPIYNRIIHTYFLSLAKKKLQGIHVYTVIFQRMKLCAHTNTSHQDFIPFSSYKLCQLKLQMKFTTVCLGSFSNFVKYTLDLWYK